jgi:hypothetical protein
MLKLQRLKSGDPTDNLHFFSARCYRESHIFGRFFQIVARKEPPSPQRLAAIIAAVSGGRKGLQHAHAEFGDSRVSNTER